MKITITPPEIKDLEKRLAEEKDRAEAWELRCEELEQELRDAQAQLDESVRKEARLGLEANKLRKHNNELKADLDKLTVDYEKEIRELRERREQLAAKLKIFDMRETVDGEQKKLIDNLQNRIHEQDWTIAKYDDENRVLRERLRKCEDEPITVSLNEWAKCIHENAVAHGWWTGGVLDGDCCGIFEDVDRPLPEILMLCVCELAESMEEYRNGKPLIYEGDNGKPEGIAVEMVDCIIRILDWMGHNGVDVDELIRKKHEYNRTRPYRHGGKKA